MKKRKYFLIQIYIKIIKFTWKNNLIFQIIWYSNNLIFSPCTFYAWSSRTFHVRPTCVTSGSEMIGQRMQVSRNYFNDAKLARCFSVFSKSSRLERYLQCAVARGLCRTIGINSYVIFRKGKKTRKIKRTVYHSTRAVCRRKFSIDNEPRLLRNRRLPSGRISGGADVTSLVSRVARAQERRGDQWKRFSSPVPSDPDSCR